MIRQIRAWRQMFRIGPARKLGTYFTEIFRYFSLEVLRGIGLFDYLKEPHTYGEILAQFNFVDSEYTRDVFDVLVTDQHPILLKEGERFRVNPAEKLPTFEEVLARTDQRYRGFAKMAVDLSNNIPLRMRGMPLDFSQSFEVPGREMMENFDELLSLRFYTINRDMSFAFLASDDLKWLHGKRLLELGCGSGRETAELWNHMSGELRITATDPVESLLNLAQKSFNTHLETINPKHAALTDSNRPDYQLASATQLPFEDNSFDAAFYCHILHYTSDPRRAIREITRVVRPDGLIFGIQIMKPYWSPFTDIVFRSNESSHGFFWREEHRRWYAENGFECETITPLGCFRAKGMKVRTMEPVPVPASMQKKASAPVAAPAPLPAAPAVASTPAPAAPVAVPEPAPAPSIPTPTPEPVSQKAPEPPPAAAAAPIPEKAPEPVQVPAQTAPAPAEPATPKAPEPASTKVEPSPAENEATPATAEPNTQKAPEPASTKAEPAAQPTATAVVPASAPASEPVSPAPKPESVASQPDPVVSKSDEGVPSSSQEVVKTPDPIESSGH